jgi:hypothetical protein
LCLNASSPPSAPMEDENNPRFEIPNAVMFAEHGGKTMLT